MNPCPLLLSSRPKRREGSAVLRTTPGSSAFRLLHRQQSSGAPHLARFSRDVGHHNTRSATPHQPAGFQALRSDESSARIQTKLGIQRAFSREKTKEFNAP